MNNFEIIDDYLSNRLPAGEQAQFEQALAGDPALKHEVELQRQIIQGVQHARAAELKAMLNAVPVPPNSWTTTHTTVTILATVAISTAVYFYFKPTEESKTISQPAASTTREQTTAKVEAEKPSSSAEVTAAASEKQVNKSSTETPSSKKEVSKPALTSKEPVKPAEKPVIQPADPTADLEQATQLPETNQPVRDQIMPSKMVVDVNSEDRRYSFHYQFSKGKLLLFGPFDKSLYEVLEINSERHLLFLYYRENYFLLDEAKTDPTPLRPITDSALLKKLREYRSQ